MLDPIMQIIGWGGNIIFALSAIPQAIKCFRQGHSIGLSMGLLSMWFIGEAIALIYGLYSEVPLPLILNYSVNFVCLFVIIFYYIFPRTYENKNKLLKCECNAADKLNISSHSDNSGSFFQGGKL